MTQDSGDSEWGETPLPATRSGPPKWMLACGCGCLVPGFLLVALVAWGMQFYGQATNPRLAYESLADVIPYDDSLKGTATGLADDPGTRALESHEDPEFRLLWGTEIPFAGGVAMYYLARGVRMEGEQAITDDDALIAMFTKVESDQSPAVMEGTASGADGEPFMIDVQGLSLSGLRLTEVSSDIIVEFPRGTMKVKGPGAFVKVRTAVAADPDDPDSKLFDVLLLLQRPEPTGEAVTDDEIREFLAPFHVGPDR